MIHRRMFLARTFSAAALCGATSEAQANDNAYDLAADRFARTLATALSTAQYQSAYNHAVQAGWVDQAIPHLSTLKGRIAEDHRNGASQRIKGIRFSDTEVTWCVAYLKRRPLA